MKKVVKAVRAKTGETWLVSIDDKLDLQKVIVEATYKNAVAIKPVAESAPEPTNDDFFDAAESLDMTLVSVSDKKKPPATRYIRWGDIDFVERL